MFYINAFKLSIFFLKLNPDYKMRIYDLKNI